MSKMSRKEIVEGYKDTVIRFLWTVAIAVANSRVRRVVKLCGL